MRVSNSLFNNSISNFYSNLYQSKISMHASKLSQDFFPVNNSKSQGTFGTDALQYINDIKSASTSLSGALKELSGPAFSQRNMVSSNSDILTVNYTGNKLNSMGDTTVRVDQTAAGQLNEGSRLNSAARYEGDRGINRFTIETGGKTTQLSVNVAAGDSNRDVQQKMATAINNAGLGLRATVETDSKTNTSILKIESSNTGSDEKNSFKISDTTGNAIARTGANDVSRENRDAVYSVNGGPAQTSKSNTVNLGNGLNVTLKEASAEEVTISRGKDTDYAKNVVRDMVQSFNSLFSAAAQNMGDPKAQGLASRIVNISSAYSNSLSSIGIGFDNSGKMTIDTNRLNQAAESGRLEQFFTENTGRNYGFTNQLGRLADNVANNTSNFVSSTLFGNALGENFSYSGFGNLVQFNNVGSGNIFDYSF